MSFHKTKKSKDINKLKEKKVRSLFCFVWYRISGIRSLIWIFVFFFLTLYVLCRIKSINLTCIQNFLNSIIGFLNVRKAAVDGWTYSYIAGVFVYYLTVVFPEAKRSQALLPIVCERIRYIKDSFYELSIALCGDDWCINKDSIENGVRQVMTCGKTESDNYYTFDYCCMLGYFVSEIDKYSDYILQLHEVLPSKYLKIILDVKYSFTLEKIRLGELKGAYFDEDGVRQFINNLKEENIKIQALHKRLYNRIYNKKRMMI